MKNWIHLNIFEKSERINKKSEWVNPLNNEDIAFDLLRQKNPELPCLGEKETVKHYTNLAEKTMSLDTSFYPLGSCTMKYNPKINEDLSSLESFTNLHPLSPQDQCQGTLSLLNDLTIELTKITGMPDFTLQPAAGAHGEYVALLIAKKYFKDIGEEDRNIVIVPDSSHGTNPASSTMAGFKTVTIKSKDGHVDLETLKESLSDKVAVFMLTNPNTLGLFEKDILTITRMVHEAGGLCYMDGANMNAMMGICRPLDMGFDMLHLNLHKTFSTPHGGGGPGAGPVGVIEKLKDYLPGPVIHKEKEMYKLATPAKSIGSVKAFYGNISVLIRAFIYIRSLGLKGLKNSSERAILNANYLLKKLKNILDIPYEKDCMHEFVAVPPLKNQNLKAIDIAKRLLDYQIHAPTVYFPLIVKEAIMIEPTETEEIPVLDEFIQTVEQIVNDAENNYDDFINFPESTCCTRLDEVNAARNPKLTWEI